MRANEARLRWPLRGPKHTGMIVIHTTEQLERARLALEQRSPQVLTAFILTLIREPNGIGNYVHTFTGADDLNAATEIVKDEPTLFKKGDRDYDYRLGQGSMAVSRLGHTLNAIELILLPANPGRRPRDAPRVIEIDAEISGNSHEDGFGVAEAFDRACVDRLKSGDEGGLRNRLGAGP
jgi:hypothetical protein